MKGDCHDFPMAMPAMTVTYWVNPTNTHLCSRKICLTFLLAKTQLNIAKLLQTEYCHSLTLFSHILVHNTNSSYTDKKENIIFLIYKEIQKGSVAKSFMTNRLLIYG